MANTKSALKYIRKTETRSLRNKVIKTRLKTLSKKIKIASESKNKDELLESSRLYISALDKAAKKGLVHKNKISRKKSICAKLLV